MPGPQHRDRPCAGIFVFGDELLVFGSPEDVAYHLEPWYVEEVSAAYDQDGNVLETFVGTTDVLQVRPVEPPEKQWSGFIDRLRARLLFEAQARPDLLSAQWVESVTGAELVQWCIAHRMEPRMPPPKPWWRFW